MLSVMEDERARTVDRIEAGKWLANRGFETAHLVIDAGVSPEDLLHDVLSKLSIEDLQTMRAILKRNSSDAGDMAEPNELPKPEEV